MNKDVVELLWAVCEGDIVESQKQAKIILDANENARDQRIKETLLKKLNTKPANRIDMPYNLEGILEAEDSTFFPENRFLLREDEKRAIEKVLERRRAAEHLADLGIYYVPSIILHGQSGTGKTMLARYLAHLAGLPYTYIRFSNLVDSELGHTQKNLSRVFNYLQTTPCVLCFDEIDGIGMKRGNNTDLEEMSRIVISLMQELDRLPNNVIIVGTTNRFDRLDPALIRRFVVSHEVKPLSPNEVSALAAKFFNSVGAEVPQLDEWCKTAFNMDQHNNSISASKVIEVCTQYIVTDFVSKLQTAR